MCGLAGIHFDDQAVKPQEAMLRRMVGTLRHRGPDGEGYLIEPGVGFGHARLSVIDLANGAQPIHNEDKSVWIAYNGEIFNFPELRDELAARGHQFYTATDTEVLVHLYEEFGDEFLERVNGQFAFALWDRRRRRLVLARDRAGILPLYWCRAARSGASGSAVLFASEAKAIFASGLIRAEVDPEGMDELWTFWGPIAPRTVFRRVEQVCPGEMVIVSGTTVTCKRYWRWEFPSDRFHRRETPEKLREELIALLEDATHIRLRADVPVGAYLSGGLDSSALVALLHRSISKSLHTFSVGFDEMALDETAHQQTMVRHLDTTHHQLRCSASDIATSFPDSVRHTESPVLRSAPAPMRLLSRAVHSEGMKVVLTGEGADEVLGGYDIFKEAKVRRFWAVNPESSWRPLLLKRLYPYLDFASSANDRYVREFFGHGLGQPDHAFFSHEPRWTMTAQCKMFWSAEFARQVKSDARERLKGTLPPEFARWNAFNRSEYLEATTLLPGYLLSSQGDRMLMASSVEGRFPYLDHRLIAFANELQPRAKMTVLREKDLLREAARKLLPPSIVERSKQPYRSPDSAAFFSGTQAEYVGELTAPAALKNYGYFDPDRTSRLVNKLRLRREATVRENMAFIGILSTQLWHAEFIQ